MSGARSIITKGRMIYGDATDIRGEEDQGMESQRNYLQGAEYQIFAAVKLSLLSRRS